MDCLGKLCPCFGRCYYGIAEYATCWVNETQKEIADDMFYATSQAIMDEYGCDVSIDGELYEDFFELAGMLIEQRNKVIFNSEAAPVRGFGKNADVS